MDQKNYDLICVTPAGRRRYMKYLVPLVLNSNFVKRYDIWVNTTNPCDLEFLNELSKRYLKINLIPQPEGKIKGNLSINAFFKRSIDENEIYLRLDDDIVWVHPNFFSVMKESRLKYADYFFVAPIIINNAICSHILQQEGRLKSNYYLRANAMDEVSWKNSIFAYKLHNWFLDHIFKDEYDKLKTSLKYISLNRFSINAICWYGKLFKEFNGIVLGDEEEYLSVIKPAEMGRINIIIGNTIVAHYAFYTQREYLDKTDLLKKYEAALLHSYSNNKDVIELYKEIKSIIEDIDKNKKTEKKYFEFSVLSKKFIKNVRIPYIKFVKLENIYNEIRIKKEKIKIW